PGENHLGRERRVVQYAPGAGEPPGHELAERRGHFEMPGGDVESHMATSCQRPAASSDLAGSWWLAAGSVRTAPFADSTSGSSALRGIWRWCAGRASALPSA